MIGVVRTLCAYQGLSLDNCAQSAEGQVRVLASLRGHIPDA